MRGGGGLRFIMKVESSTGAYGTVCAPFTEISPSSTALRKRFLRRTVHLEGLIGLTGVWRVLPNSFLGGDTLTLSLGVCIDVRCSLFRYRLCGEMR